MSILEKCINCSDITVSIPQIFKMLVRIDSDGNYYLPLKLNLCSENDILAVQCGSDYNIEQIVKPLIVMDDCNHCAINVSIDNSSIDLICPDAPEDFKVEWIDDFARITFDDKTGGLGDHEVWENVDGDGFALVYTIPAGIESYDYYTWQNADLDFRLRSKIGDLYSAFTHTENIISPLVIKTDQSILQQVLFHVFTITGAGKTINIDWGDGNDADYVSGANPDITHDYAGTGTYYIQFSGDVDYLWFFEATVQTYLLANLEKWKLPLYLKVLHTFDNGFYGDITDIEFNNDLGIFHIRDNEVNGNVTDWQFPLGLYEIRLADNNLTGDISGWDLSGNDLAAYFYLELNSTSIGGDLTDFDSYMPSNLKALMIYDAEFSGDLTDWVIPSDCGFLKIGDNTLLDQGCVFTGDLTTWTLPTNYAVTMGYRIDLTGYGFTGDLSGWTITDLLNVNMYFYLGKNNFTKLPRGGFLHVYVLNAEENNCDQAEIDAFLAHVDGYFVGAVVPIIDATYELDGVGMAIPSAAGLASRTSIINKYTAQGKTCVINVNS